MTELIVKVKLSESVYSPSLTETLIFTSPKKLSAGINCKLFASKDNSPDLLALSSAEKFKPSPST